jgi:hypothetical protein
MVIDHRQHVTIHLVCTLVVVCWCLTARADISTERLPGLENVNPDPYGEPWIAGGITRDEWSATTDRMPALARRAAAAAIAALPAKIDNTVYPAFRPVFTQKGGSCGQACAIGYLFTYEINYHRGLASNIIDNQYPYDFTYNFLNLGSGSNGSMPDQGLSIVKALGVPNVKTYGGFGLGAFSTWVSGYPVYYNAMTNRIKELFKINVSTVDGLTQMKQWLFDHQSSASQGGCLVYSYDASGEKITTIPSGLPEAGKKIMPLFGNGGGHAVTIAGYNDSVRYDYNNDGKFTNNVDQNNDGRVDIKDWEIGAFLMVNSWGAGFGNSGRIWVPYRMCAHADGIWSSIVYGLKTLPEKTFTPLLTYKVTLTHSDRSQLRIRAGYANNASATAPATTKMFSNTFNYKGGTFPLQGTPGNPIEIGLDVSDFCTSLTADEVALFLLIDSRNGSGTVGNFSLLDYSLGSPPVELACTRHNVNIPVGTTTLKIVKTQKRLIVLTPNNGEKLEHGRVFQITWFDRLSENVKIELLKSNAVVTAINPSAPANSVCDWTVPADLAPGADYKIKISNLGNTAINDMSDSTFTIKQRSTLDCTAPNGGDYIEKGKEMQITWKSDIAGNLRIDLYKDRMRDTTLAVVAAQSGSYTWRVAPLIPSDISYSIRLTSADNPLVFDESDNDFIIVHPIVAIPYSENFDSFTAKTKTLTAGWEQATDDDFDWTVYTGQTPSRVTTAAGGGGTGPDGDHTYTYGNYIYMEASSPNNPARRTTVLSPMFNTERRDKLQITFWCHMFSRDNHMGQLAVDLFANGVWRDSVLTLTGNHGDAWFPQTIFVSEAFPEFSAPITRLQVRLRGVTGTAYDSDICIDDFRIEGSAVPVGRRGIASRLIPNLMVRGNLLHYRHLAGTLTIYAINGQRVHTVMVPGSGVVDCAILPAGAYVARAGRDMVKFIRE